MNWQPIETAPKDKEILCIDENDNIRICDYHSLENKWNIAKADADYGNDLYKPTHWQ